jgi:hypothetical protein
MNAKIDTFSQRLRAKLEGVDKRLKDLRTSATNATDKARAEAKAQLATIESRAKDQRGKVQAAEAKVKAWTEEQKVATSEKIATCKTERNLKRLTAHAESAEDYPIASMQLAADAIDEAERAAIEAVVARIDADAAQT